MTDYKKLFAEESYEEDETAYRFKINDFECPLDALLFLIRKSKVDIEDVKISEITEQYLEMIKDLEEVDLDKASEFITMASLLLEIKSKSLLPKPPEPEPDAVDEEKELKRQLKLYALYKEAAEKMKETETEDIFYREPDPSVGMPRLQLKDMNRSGLMDALKRMFVKLEERAALQKERHIIKDRFTVAEMVNIVKDKLELKNELSFFELFDLDYNKSEIITTFQALLELIKTQYVVAKQDALFEDIIISKVVEDGN